MRQLFAFALLATPLLFAGPAAAQSGGDDALPELATTEVRQIEQPGDLEDLIAFVNGIDTMSADFVQFTPDSKAAGSLNMARPGRIRFEYSDGTPILIVSDGHNVSLVDYELGQVTKWPVSDTPLSLLLKNDISPDQVEEFVQVEDGVIRRTIHLKPGDPDESDLGKMTLFFSGRPGGQGKEAMSIDGWEVEDAQGIITTVYLSNQTYNQPLDKELWTFEDPRNERFDRRRRR